MMQSTFRNTLMIAASVALVTLAGAALAEPEDRGMVEGWQLWSNWEGVEEEAKGCWLEKEQDGTTLRYEITMYAENLYLGVAGPDKVDGAVAVDGTSYTAHYTRTADGDWAVIARLPGAFGELLSGANEMSFDYEGRAYPFDLGNMMSARRSLQLCVAGNQ